MGRPTQGEVEVGSRGPPSGPRQQATADPQPALMVSSAAASTMVGVARTAASMSGPPRTRSAGSGWRSPSRHLPARPGNPLAARLAAGVVLAGGIWVAVLAVTSVPAAQLAAAGGPATLAGTATGLVGTYLAMVMVLLAGRVAPVERAVGLDRLLRWHRRLAPWPILLIVAHAVLITVGYAQAARSGIGAEIRSLVLDYPDVLAATAALGLMVAVGVASLRFIRSRIRRESWWVLHLYLYLALALAFAHAVVLGPTFVGHPLTQAVWSVAWAATAGLVVVYRIGLPLARSLRHQLRVVEVQPEAPGVVSIVLRGRRLDRLPTSGGQFALWRFLQRGLWWQAHPYTLSALPQPPYLRITVKAVGDHSAELARLRPGTRVLIEGPYGAFTRHARRAVGGVALLGAGIGVTAIRALLEDLPASARPVVVLRATSAEELPLRREVGDLVRRSGGELHELFGSRRQVRLGPDVLHRLVPDLAARDVYICGPDQFVADMTALSSRLGVPPAAIHHEAYAL